MSDLSTEEMVTLMRKSLTDDDSCDVLADHLEAKGIEIHKSLVTQAFEIMSEGRDARRLLSEQRRADVRVMTRRVLAEMDAEAKQVEV